MTELGTMGAMTLPLIPAPAQLDLADGEPYEASVAPSGPSVPDLSTDGADLPDDGSYRLTVTPEGVRSEAGGSQGRAAARATWDQLVRLTGGSVPTMAIADRPRYAWRGVMIDIARHFFDADTLRKVVDLAALYKLNVLHLHLTDDQGWRFEVDQRPELTDISGKTAMNGDPGGHLHADELAELVAYAAERGITIVGEIDVPGHSTAAMHATPALNPDGVARTAIAEGGIFDGVLDLSLPETAPFLRDVLGALAAATPGEFLHVGGDEVPSLSREQYQEVIRHLETLVLGLGKRPVFWQEAAFALQDPRSVVQLWDSNADPAEVVAAAARGHQIVLSPANRVYLDMKHDGDDRLGLEWAGTVDVRDSYEWDPDTAVPGLPPASILGVEAALWTETVRTEEDLFAMLLPRLAAVAEVGWSAPEVRDWESFAEDLREHGPLWDEAGLSYSRREQVFGAS